MEEVGKEIVKQARPCFGRHAVCRYGPGKFVVGGVLALGAFLIVRKIYRRTKKKPVAKPGVVLLHQIPRGSKSPNVSPFALKLETYLRLAKIPYEVDTTLALAGPKGKFPWITLDGQEFADSTFIVNFLNQRFGVNLNKDLDDVTKANFWALQTMIEDHMFWIVALQRFGPSGTFKLFRQIYPLPQCRGAIMFYIKRGRVTKKGRAQGMGLHSEAERLQLARKDLATLSKILGEKPYFGGQKPAEIDCVVFGFTVQWLYNAPGSDYEALIHEEELKNVVEHCHRMKELVWPDWENVLQKE